MLICNIYVYIFSLFTYNNNKNTFEILSTKYKHIKLLVFFFYTQKVQVECISFHSSLLII